MKTDRQNFVPRLLGGALSLLLAALPLSAQNNLVTGVVTDESGEPVPGATVMVKGTSRGNSTDTQGIYRIVATSDETIMVSCIGYVTQETRVGNASRRDFILVEDENMLEETVVVGYGTMRKRDLVGAVEVVKGEELTNRPNPNVVRSLQGAVPGLTLQFSDGKPSHGATLNIRDAASSIGSGGSALVIVDGIYGDLTTLNPEDIESISVLKDASSCAVYGARGAFGVILVTTKTAQEGDFTVKYNAAFSVLSRTVTPNFNYESVSWTQEFLDSYVACYGYKPSSVNNLVNYSDEWFEELQTRCATPGSSYYGVSSDGLYEYYSPGTNWDKLLYKDYTTSYQHDLSISGGTDKMKVYISGRYFHQDGIYNSDIDYYWQANARAKVDIKVKRWWILSNSIDFVKRKYKQPMYYSGKANFNRVLEHQGYPFLTPYNEDGTWTQASVVIGYAEFKTGLSYQENLKFDMNENIINKFTLIQDVLELQADFTYTFNNSQRNRKENIYSYDLGPGYTAYRSTYDSYEEQHYNFDYWKANIFATFTPSLGSKHDFKLMGGWNIEYDRYRNTSVYRRGLVVDTAHNFSLMDGDYYDVHDGGSYTWAYVGFVGRANYILMDRYLAEVSARYDGSSKFPTSQRWGFFPSASLGWRISGEPFMQGVTWIDNLKLRASAGSLGNGNVAAYAYLQTMSISNTSVLIDGAKASMTSAPDPIPDGLTWERSTTYDVGLDFDALGNRLNFVGDFYVRTTTDMYTVGKTLPAVYGADSPYGNYADMRTIGWELSLGWRDSFKLGGRDFGYGVKAMVWDAKSTITKYNNETKSLTDYYSGMVLGEIWGLHVAGLFESDEEAAAWADQSTFMRVNRNGNVFQAGDLKFEDLNGDGYINYGKNTVDDPGDMTIIGNEMPRYLYSFNFDFHYANWGLSIFFQGVGKKDWYPSYNCGYFWGKYNRPYGFSIPDQTNNRWTEENQDTDAFWPRLVTYLASDSSSAMLTRVANDRYLVDVSYCRLKTITLEYNIPKKILDKVGVKGLRLYLTGDNLLTFSPITKWTKNFDPEVINSGDSDFNGYNSASDGDHADGYSYPMLKSVTVGLNLTF